MGNVVKRLPKRSRIIGTHAGEINDIAVFFGFVAHNGLGVAGNIDSEKQAAVGINRL